MNNLITVDKFGYTSIAFCSIYVVPISTVEEPGEAEPQLLSTLLTQKSALPLAIRVNGCFLAREFFSVQGIQGAKSTSRWCWDEDWQKV